MGIYVVDLKYMDGSDVSKASLLNKHRIVERTL